MSQAIRDRFANAGDRSLFIPYVTAGYPTMEDTVPILLALEAAGADVIEIGVPFTDPLGDGATIQHANQIALDGGITFDGCLQIIDAGVTRLPTGLRGDGLYTETRSQDEKCGRSNEARRFSWSRERRTPATANQVPGRHSRSPLLCGHPNGAGLRREIVA